MNRVETLDPKALEAAHKAFYDHGGNILALTSPDRFEAAIRTYLNALSTPIAAGELAVKVLRDGLTASRSVVEALIGHEYNVETWDLRSRLAAIDAAISALDHTTLPAAEGMREALQRISALTPEAANAASARDLHLTVKAIADTALSSDGAR